MKLFRRKSDRPREDPTPSDFPGLGILSDNEETIADRLGEADLDLVSAGVDAGRSLWIFDDP